MRENIIKSSVIRFWAILALLVLGSLVLHVAAGHVHGNYDGSNDNHNQCPLCHFASQVLPATPTFIISLVFPLLYTLFNQGESPFEKYTIRSCEYRAPPFLSL